MGKCDGALFFYRLRSMKYESYFYHTRDVISHLEVVCSILYKAVISKIFEKGEYT